MHAWPRLSLATPVIPGSGSPEGESSEWIINFITFNVTYYSLRVLDFVSKLV